MAAASSSAASARALLRHVLRAPQRRLATTASQPPLLLLRPTGLAAPQGSPAAVAAAIVPLAVVPQRRLSAAAAAAASASASASAPAEAGRLVKIATNSKLANREDVKGALAAALEGQGGGHGAEVRQLDQILFKGVYPSNMWLVEVGSREAAQRLVRQGQIQSPCGNLRVEEIREEDLARLQLASALGLDACAVHVQNVPANMGVDEVAYFFRDFRVRPEGIRPVPVEGQQEQQQDRFKGRQQHAYHQQRQRRSFMVQFESPDEAQRAIREKQAEPWGMGKVHIVSYK